MARAIKSYIRTGLRREVPGPRRARRLLRHASPTTARRPPRSKENGGLSRERAAEGVRLHPRRRQGRRSPAARASTEYRILVVAEKYQTGFDQPLLTTMYVNKKLDRHLRRADPVPAQPHRRAQDAGRPGRAGLRQRGRGHPGGVPAVLRGGEDPPLRPEPALHRAEPGDVPADPRRHGDAGVRRGLPRRRGEGRRLAGEVGEAARRAVPAALTRPSPGSPRSPTARTRTTRRPPRTFRADLNDYVRKYGFLVADRARTTTPELERLTCTAGTCSTGCPAAPTAASTSARSTSATCGSEQTGEHDLGLTPEGPADDAGLRRRHGRGQGAGEVAAVGADRTVQREVRHGASPSRTSIRPFEEAMADPKVRLAAVANNDRTTSASSSTTCSRTRWPTTSTPSRTWAASTSARTRTSGAR